MEADGQARHSTAAADSSLPAASAACPPKLLLPPKYGPQCSHQGPPNRLSSASLIIWVLFSASAGCRSLHPGGSRGRRVLVGFQSMH